MKMKNRQNNKHQSLCTTALSMLPQARGSRHSHEASTTEKLKAARKEAHPTTEGTASLSISFGQREKKKIQREHRQLYSWWRWAQNWPALLGSHCRRRTMDGSLLAPRMNSSRESFPSRLVSIWRKIFSVRFSGVDSSSGIFITEETIL